MKLKKTFYDLPAINGRDKLQGSVITSLGADKQVIINKIVARYFYGQPIIGWNIDKIAMTSIIIEE